MIDSIRFDSTHLDVIFVSIKVAVNTLETQLIIIKESVTFALNSTIPNDRWTFTKIISLNKRFESKLNYQFELKHSKRVFVF